MTLDYLGVVDQARLAATGEVTARQLVEHSLGVIARRNPALNAFTRVMVDEALAAADALDARFAAGGPAGPLHGVPVAVKEEYDVAGVPTTFGTNAVTHAAPRDCEAVRRLRAAGAIIIGKTTMPEFGQWPFTESTTYGFTRNPWQPAYSTAGSSGGTAAAVASGMVAAGIGGDGGGSIRLPAAWCGLFGAKAQRGRISTAPNRALWRGLGVLGPLTRTVADSARLFDVLAGNLPSDRYRVPPWPEPLTEVITRELPPCRILVAERPAKGPALEAQTRAALHRVAEALAGLGHDVVWGELPPYRPGLAMTGQMAGGVLDELKLLDSPRLLEARTRHAIPFYRLLAPYARAAERRWEPLAETMFTVFDRYDVLLTPTTPYPPRRLGVLAGHELPRTIKVSLELTADTARGNVLGNPAAAIPAGFTADGLPLSAQLVVAPRREPLLFQVAAGLERALPWRDRVPPEV
ncbi:MAG: amidase [Propionibacteriaceae bacterium]|nr:amidase [Propionibacteriaceae bacterium]